MRNHREDRIGPLQALRGASSLGRGHRVQKGRRTLARVRARLRAGRAGSSAYQVYYGNLNNLFRQSDRSHFDDDHSAGSIGPRKPGAAARHLVGSDVESQTVIWQGGRGVIPFKTEISKISLRLVGVSAAKPRRKRLLMFGQIS